MDRHAVLVEKPSIAERRLNRDTVQRLRRVIAAIRRGFEPGRTARPGRRPRRQSSELAGVPVRLPEGECLLLRRRATPFLRRGLHLVPDKPDWRPGLLHTQQLHELHILHEALPHGVVYMDLETCGLKARPVFLVGLLHFDTADGWVVDQYFARHYGEEAAILQAFWNRFRDSRVLVTFNGKAFDFPFIVDRSRYHRLKLPSATGRRRREIVHCDVLLYARRLWKYRLDLPDCRLQTLEWCLCGREREQDIPGREIPLAYERFVRTGRSDEIARILNHNFYDLVTLAELSFRVLSDLSG